MNAHAALNLIRNDLLSRFALLALDVPTRSKAQYFRTLHGKVFGLILGNLVGGRFSHGTVDLLMEPTSLPVDLLTKCQLIDKPYRGSSTEQKTKGIFLKDAQTRVRVTSEAALTAVLAWYARARVPELTPAVSEPALPVGGNAPAVMADIRIEPEVGTLGLRPVAVTGKGDLLSTAPKKGLLIRDPWLEQILCGEKTWEMRSRDTAQRGWVALIKAGSGKVYGMARIVDSFGPLSDAQMKAHQDRHGIPPERLPEVTNYRYAWVLAEVKRLSRPVPYLHRSGAVIFAVLDAEARERIAVQLP